MSSATKRKRGGADAGGRAPPALRDSANDNSNYDDHGLTQIIAHNQSTNADGHPNGNESAASDTAAAALNHYQLGRRESGPPATGGLGGRIFQLGVGSETLAQTLERQTLERQLKDAAEDSSNKPAVGSDEWHKIRRDNHKEVERRRREAINEGINELSRIVPGAEKNKGSILQRAVQYIRQIKDNEEQNIEKWTLEKLLLDQAINELSATAERLKEDANNAWAQRDLFKKACEDNDIDVPGLKELLLEQSKNGSGED